MVQNAVATGTPVNDLERRSKRRKSSIVTATQTIGLRQHTCMAFACRSPDIHPCRSDHCKLLHRLPEHHKHAIYMAPLQSPQAPPHSNNANTAEGCLQSLYKWCKNEKAR